VGDHALGARPEAAVNAASQFVEFVTTSANWWGRKGILVRSWEHVKISVFCTVAAVALTVPLAVLLGHRRRFGLLAVSVVNIGRALPTFAIMVLVFPFALRWGWGLGFWPASVALIVLAMPPVFTNAYTGVAEVDPAVVESARGMGMTGREVLWRVELPVALPLLLTGVRVAAVQVVATATLAHLDGFNCLGSYIFEGKVVGPRGQGRLLCGAVGVAVLAVATELAFGALERRLTPWNRMRHAMAADPALDAAPARAGVTDPAITGETP
jgi:osmoprotectant transport system permease protein